MLKKTVSGMTAQKLRLLLLAGIVTLVLIAGAIFWLVRGHLLGYALQVQQSTAEASSSTQNLATLENLKTQLAQDADTVERTKNIVAESKSYAYQDQIIKDINTYADRSGVSVSGYTFNTNTPAAAPSSTTAAAPQAAAGTKTVNLSERLQASVTRYDHHHAARVCILCMQSLLNVDRILLATAGCRYKAVVCSF